MMTLIFSDRKLIGYPNGSEYKPVIRTVDNALTLANEWRGHESVGEDVYTDLVILADEVLRLRGDCNDLRRQLVNYTG